MSGWKCLRVVPVPKQSVSKQSCVPVIIGIAVTIETSHHQLKMFRTSADADFPRSHGAWRVDVKIVPFCRMQKE
jgi:hypothetical protein